MGAWGHGHVLYYADTVRVSLIRLSSLVLTTFRVPTELASSVHQPSLYYAFILFCMPAMASSVASSAQIPSAAITPWA